MTTRQFITKSGDTFEWEETPEVLAALKKLHETDYTEPTVKIYDLTDVLICIRARPPTSIIAECSRLPMAW